MPEVVTYGISPELEDELTPTPRDTDNICCLCVLYLCVLQGMHVDKTKLSGPALLR